jgi:Flp pilus assembly protein TadD
LIKILSNRIKLLPFFVLLTACAGGEYSKYTEKDEGPFEARARNNLAANNPMGLVKVGEGFERSGNLTAALNMYGQAMAADASLIEPQVAYARVLIKGGERERGLAVLTALIADHPERNDVRTELTRFYVAEGNFEAAQLFFQPIADADTVAPASLLLGGKIAAVMGEGTKAREMFERALVAVPGNPEILENLGLSFALEGEFAAANGLIQQAMDEPSGLISGKIALATIYALSGQTDAAMQLAYGSMKREEANAKLVFYQLLPRMNEREQAEAVFFNRVPKDALARLSGNVTVGASN